MIRLLQFKQCQKTAFNLFKPAKFTFSDTNNEKQLRHYGQLLNIPFSAEYMKRNSTPIQQYVNIYRKYGHYYGNLDPLNLIKRPQEILSPLDLGLKYQDDITQQIDKESSFIATLESVKDVTQLEEQLQKIYKNTVGVEFDHIQSSQEKDWLYYNFEKYQLQEVSDVEKKNMHNLLIQTEALDHYLHKKFNTFKRYAGEGAESAITALKTLFAKASEQGVTDIVLGIPHRGRLNVLCNLLDYPPKELMRKIKGYNDMPHEIYTAVDDVVSHIAVSKKKTYVGTGCKEQPITVTMLHNPSHLEAINPVSMGKTRAKQDEYGNKQQVLNVQCHGDSAFSAQGIVYESFAASIVDKFNIGGTVHLIINNQIGYTTSIKDSRGQLYCSEIAKAFNAPILHVNSDDPETLHKMVKFVVEYRQKYQKDIVIDLICYRKYGHNEVDEPEFTQPFLYHQIRKCQTTLPKLFHDKLVNQGLVKSEFYQTQREKVFSLLEKEYENITTEPKTISQYTDEKAKGSRSFTGKWKDMTFSINGENKPTGLPIQYMKDLAKQSVTLPADFTPHPRLQKFFISDRIKQVDNNKIDWATAEAVAIGSLLDNGYNVRMSGQDVERGTFSQRHWVLVDQKKEQDWNPLKELFEAQNKGKLHCYNSPLSEMGVLSYEYGYSLNNPNNLCIWEAQFGDFFNCAQVAIDVYITGSEAKWARQSSITLILPHGYDGAGPEHSSCRIERFLQLGSTDGIVRNLTLKEHDPKRKALRAYDEVFYANHQDINFQFVFPTTPANYFHILRRQMLRNYRKPLVIAGPKALLRLPECKSQFEDMGETSQFQPILERVNITEQTKNIILCSGKFSYDILKQIANKSNFSLLVIDELLPFPETVLKQKLSKANKSAKVFWVQEEPSNCGAYSYCEPHISRVLKELEFSNQSIQYIGRRAIAVTATGISKEHDAEIKDIMTTIDKIQ